MILKVNERSPEMAYMLINAQPIRCLRLVGSPLHEIVLFMFSLLALVVFVQNSLDIIINCQFGNMT